VSAVLLVSSTVLFGHFAAAKCPHRTPQILVWYSASYPTADYCTYIAKPYPLHPVIFCTPASFSQFLWNFGKPHRMAAFKLIFVAKIE